MRIAVTTGLVVVLMAGLARGQEGKSDLKKMQGTWIGTIISDDGNIPTEEDKQLQIKLIIAGDSYRALAGDTPLMEGKLQLDPAHTPCHIDAIFGMGTLKGAVQKGIYELKGDELTVNFAPPSKDRPRSLETSRDSGEATVRYRREK